MAELAQVVDLGQARARRQARASEPWVGKREIARHFGKSERTIENWVRDRGMPSVQRFPNSHRMFRVSECDEWFEGGRAS